MLATCQFLFKAIYSILYILLDESIILPGSTRHRVRLASPSLPVYHEQIPTIIKAIFDSIKDVMLLSGLKVDVVEFVVVRSFAGW